MGICRVLIADGDLRLRAQLGVALAAWRSPLLRDEADPAAPVSREGAFLAGNWLFLVFAFVVLLGTLFPTFVEFVQGRRDASVGPAFFNAFAGLMSRAQAALESAEGATSSREDAPRGDAPEGNRQP